MTFKRRIGAILQNERVNFVLTNRLPRNALTLLMGRFSRIEHRLIREPSLWAFRFFADDLNLREAKRTDFRSLHDCFVRELKEGARPIDPRPNVVVSPCDAIVGAGGVISSDEIVQAKGMPYSLTELLRDDGLAAYYVGGRYVTLRLQASMYHRFHAPEDCVVESLTYVAGDVWNVNPIALRRVRSLFARNERAVLRTRLRDGELLTLVPVAAILVASMRFTFADVRLHLKYAGPNEIPCGTRLVRGQEMGHFEHGSTILVFAPPGFGLAAGVAEGASIRVGAALFERISDSPR
jgi:phosphatidylserine decarboxylase